MKKDKTASMVPGRVGIQADKILYESCDTYMQTVGLVINSGESEIKYSKKDINH